MLIKKLAGMVPAEDYSACAPRPSGDQRRFATLSNPACLSGFEFVDA